MFQLAILLCHWFACIYFAIGGGDSSEVQSWVVIEGLSNEGPGLKYLRSFYWSLYTITTVGYGSVPCNTIRERVFAMIVMAIGAVICDAGITAVLTSLISNKDQQAGTNNRRIRCCTKFMNTSHSPQDLKERILDFYSYADADLKNLDENDIFNNLSATLKHEILSFFCYDALRAGQFIVDLDNGSVVSLVNSMRPYVAIPYEKLSEIGKDCT